MSQQTEPELRTIQAWLHTFVVEPGDREHALRAAEARSGLESGSAEELILPSPTLQPSERIQIYRQMYLLRMYEAMEIDFPVLLAHLGEDRFHDLVDGYVQAYPSKSYTLDHLGGHFSRFLAEAKNLDDNQLLQELAQLEWALCEVAIAHDSPTLSLSDLSSVPPDEFLDLRLSPIPALRTLVSKYNVNDLFKAYSSEAIVPAVCERETRLVVWRHDLKVWRLELSPAGFAFLREILTKSTLGVCLDHTIDRFDCEETQLFEWFQEWSSEGMFSGFEHPKK